MRRKVKKRGNESGKRRYRELKKIREGRETEGRETERERQRERQRKRERQRERDRQTDRQGDRQADRQKGRCKKEKEDHCLT